MSGRGGIRGGGMRGDFNVVIILVFEFVFDDLVQAFGVTFDESGEVEGRAVVDGNHEGEDEHERVEVITAVHEHSGGHCEDGVDELNKDEKRRRMFNYPRTKHEFVLVLLHHPIDRMRLLLCHPSQTRHQICLFYLLFINKLRLHHIRDLPEDIE